MASPQLSELQELSKYLSPQQQSELDKLLSEKLWVPLPGPQTEAYHSKADVLFYGGAAGGGKTDLGIGLALMEHTRSIIFRREGTQLKGITDRMIEIMGTKDGFNGHEGVWPLPKLGRGKQIEFGHCAVNGDETKYQGRAHDLKIFDELPLFLESQFRFLNGWLRSTNPLQRKRVVCLGNPPTDSDGEWVTRYWAPWLDPNYPRPAKPGELRWFAMLSGKDTEVESGEPFEYQGETIQPQSRTFIPSKVQDNPFLLSTGYMAQLQALPEPLRSQMLKGDFLAGREDSPWQVVPTEWVFAAQARWKPRDVKGSMSSVGCDVARGGKDKTVIARRHDNWYDTLLSYPGASTPDGPTVAGLVLAATRNGAPVYVDVIGVGASVFDFLSDANVSCVGVSNSERSEATDSSGRLGFLNKRAELYWMFRQALDPANDQGIALPPDDELRADLCAPRWALKSGKIQIESKDDLIKRMGRSPDKADAIILASIDDGGVNRDELKYPKMGYV